MSEKDLLWMAKVMYGLQKMCKSHRKCYGCPFLQDGVDDCGAALNGVGNPSWWGIDADDLQKLEHGCKL